LLNSSTAAVSLDAAPAAEEPLLANLLELYVHDLSGVFSHVELGPNGRFGYPRLPLYWLEPAMRFPFVIRCDGRVAGFVLATRGSPVIPDADVHDVAEFFVMRQYRGGGVGKEAAMLLWRRFPCRWTVRVADGNAAAMAFWRAAIAKIPSVHVTEWTLSGGLYGWRVFQFDAAGLS
jgi:predicted acetyltransferase